MYIYMDPFMCYIIIIIIIIALPLWKLSAYVFQTEISENLDLPPGDTPSTHSRSESELYLEL
jgi:hypothetical protein